MFVGVVPATLAPAADRSTWYAFEPNNTSEPGEIGMQDWIAKPAGQHGRIVRQDDKLLYNGEPIKLWGINPCYGACSPEKELADKRAAFYPKYGINSVRLHKCVDGPGWAGVQAADNCAAFDPQGLDRMDYQVAPFQRAGIHVLLWAHFGALKLGPADRRFVPWREEFGGFEGDSGRITTPHSAVHDSPELQGVQIRQTVNLLQHKNPYTDLTCAQDAWIETQRDSYPLKLRCRVLRVSRSGYYAWRRRTPSPRIPRRQQIRLSRRAVPPRFPWNLWLPAGASGPVGQPRDRLLSRDRSPRDGRVGPPGRHKRHFVPTTDSNHQEPIAANRLQRDFTATRPDQKWLAAVTYIRLTEGRLYLTVVLDCFSRRVVGWSLSRRIDAALVCTALEMALRRRCPQGDRVHHSDRGVPCASEALRSLLQREGLTMSMSRQGDPWDNAMMESFFGSLKTEWIDTGYATEAQA